LDLRRGLDHFGDALLDGRDPGLQVVHGVELEQEHAPGFQWKTGQVLPQKVTPGLTEQIADDILRKPP
jgi:hypothetical protein